MDASHPVLSSHISRLNIITPTGIVRSRSVRTEIDERRRPIYGRNGNMNNPAAIVAKTPDWCGQGAARHRRVSLHTRSGFAALSYPPANIFLSPSHASGYRPSNNSNWKHRPSETADTGSQT